MPRNVEIKARLRDPEATRRLVAAAADGPPTLLEQTDTFFRVTGGRLKLRECGDGTAELIHYERPDGVAPRGSRYAKAAVPDSAALRGLLEAALGVRGSVVKRRNLFRVGRTRVHLDDVRGLGAFLELEVEMAEGEGEPAGVAEAQRLMRTFGIGDEALVAEAYVDLLEREGLSEKTRTPRAGGAPLGETEPMADDDIRQLLREIRDGQREHLAEYRRVAERSQTMQQEAVARQEAVRRISRRLALTVGSIVVALLALLVFILGRFWRLIFT